MNSSINSHQCCPPETAKVQTVQNVAGIQQLANSFVRVLGNNSVYYVSRAHEVTLISSQPVEVRGYDNANNPANYRNQIAYDLQTNELTYFTNAGIAVPLSSAVQLSDLEALDAKFSAQIRDVTAEITDLTTQVNQANTEIETVKANLATETEAREQGDTTLTASVNDVADQVSTLSDDVTDLGTEVDALKQTEVQTNTDLSADPSTVTLTKTRGPLTGEQTTEEVALPVASEDQAGVMNAATYSAVQQNSENINSILGGAVAVENLSATPTQDELTEAWKTATGQSELINRASILDTTNSKTWYYYENISSWQPVGNGGAEVTVSVFTNDSAGIVKGSTEPGQIYAEANGTGSVVGWDGVMHDIDNLTELINGIDVPKLYTGYSTATDGANTAKFINTTLNSNFLTLGNGAKATYGSKRYIAIGNSADAQTTNSSNAQGNIALGSSAKAGGSISSVAIGSRAQATNSGAVAIGGWPSGTTDNTTQATGSYSIALGTYARSTGSDGVALGYHTTAAQPESVALGSNARTSRSNEVSIGGGSSTSLPTTRYLANLTAGELPTDAVNLQQMQDYVSEHGGNPFTEMETTRVQNLPPAVVTGFEDTTYNAADITMHLDTKDLATGGVAVQELTLQPATPAIDGAVGSAGIMSAFQATQLQALAEASEQKQLTDAEVTKVQNLDTGSVTNMDGVVQLEDEVQLEFNRVNLTTGASETQVATIGAATTEEAGVMTPEMVEQLNNAGGGVELLSAYTTTDIAGKAYDASYINSRLNANNVALGSSASVGTSGYVHTAVGNGATASGDQATALGGYSLASAVYSVAIGAKKNTDTVATYQTQANAGYSVAIGTGAKTGSSAASSVALGTQAYAYNANSVALGNAAVTTRNGEVSIGGGSTATRYLANVKAGTLDTDAVNVKQMNDAISAALLEKMYPVGSIYMSATLSTADAVGTALGGTWEAWGQGRVPVGVNTADTTFASAGLIGGEKAHTLTVTEMPSHTHTYYEMNQSGSWSVGAGGGGRYSGTDLQTKPTGGSGAHNNLQPYITCYMYKRTA